MTVEELIAELNKIQDKELEVRLGIEPTNYWVNEIEVHNTGDSGYEEEGEVILIGTE